MNPLEALNELRFEGLTEEYRNKCCNIIETALKEYELIKNTTFIVADKKISDEDLEKLKKQRMFIGSLVQCEIKPLFDEETTKKLKALEIIKKKRVDVGRLITSNDLEDYRSRIICDYGSYSLELTQEEFNLLKEELL